MKNYLLSIYQPGDGVQPAPEILEPIMREVYALHEDMKAQGALVFTGGLHPPSSATVVRASAADISFTDGPFIEGKEHLGGFSVIRAEDLDAALKWAQRLSRATTLPIEVRPFFDMPPG